MNDAQRYAAGGFTLVELVVVMVMLGIVAAVATPRFFNDRTFLERGYYEELAAALKYAQRLAVASGCGVRMEISAAGYEARQQQAVGTRCDPTDTTWATAVPLADGRFLVGASPSGVGITPAVTITFDALGRTDLAADEIINVGPFAMTVRAESGYVQSQ